MEFGRTLELNLNYLSFGPFLGWQVKASCITLTPCLIIVHFGHLEKLVLKIFFVWGQGKDKVVKFIHAKN